MNESEYEYLKSKIFTLTKLDLNNYKSGQMKRRLEGFIDRTHGTHVAEYCKILQQDPAALLKLKDFLTINVSDFFRDAAPFEVLKTHILPELLQRNRDLKIWSAGCSIGSEPYSIAMLLRYLSPAGNHRILATDLDQKVLAKASNGGPYTIAEVKGVPHVYLVNHFTKSEEGYLVTEHIRRRVKFKQHNLMDGPPEHGFDLILCRNVMIYFTDQAKNMLHRGFSKALNPGGVLVLGSTEALLACQEMGLSRLNTSFYRKDDAAGTRASRRAPRVLAKV